MQRNLDNANRDIGLVFRVGSDHRAVVHFVDMISGQDQDLIGAVFTNFIDILVDAIRRAQVPVLSDLLLCRDDLDELTKFAAR